MTWESYESLLQKVYEYVNLFSTNFLEILHPVALETTGNMSRDTHVDIIHRSGSLLETYPTGTSGRPHY